MKWNERNWLVEKKISKKNSFYREKMKKKIEKLFGIFFVFVSLKNNFYKIFFSLFSFSRATLLRILNGIGIFNWQMEFFYLSIVFVSYFFLILSECASMRNSMRVDCQMAKCGVHWDMFMCGGNRSIRLAKFHKNWEKIKNDDKILETDLSLLKALR